MSERADDFAGVADMLDPIDDEALMPIASLRIVLALDSDGGEQVRFKFEGQQNLSGTLGLLEYVKQALWTAAVNGTGLEGD